MSKSEKTAAIPTGMPYANPAALEPWKNIVTQSTQFVANRLEHDLETQQALLDCRTPTELLEIQTQYFQKAMQDYTAQASRVFSLMSTTTETALKDANTAHKRAYDDVPL